MAQRRRCGSFGSLPYIERRAIDVEYGELTTRWSYSHVRSPPLAEAATPPEVVAQYVQIRATMVVPPGPSSKLRGSGGHGGTYRQCHSRK